MSNNNRGDVQARAARASIQGAGAGNLWYRADVIAAADVEIGRMPVTDKRYIFTVKSPSNKGRNTVTIP